MTLNVTLHKDGVEYKFTVSKEQGKFYAIAENKHNPYFCIEAETEAKALLDGYKAIEYYLNYADAYQISS